MLSFPRDILSKCCQKPLTVSTADEGTSCYMCTSCDKPSDPIPQEENNDAEAKEEVESFYAMAHPEGCQCDRHKPQEEKKKCDCDCHAEIEKGVYSTHAPYSCKCHKPQESSWEEKILELLPGYFDDRLIPFIRTLLADETTKAYEAGRNDKTPMGVSQWKAHGEKYGYDTYFHMKPRNTPVADPDRNNGF